MNEIDSVNQLAIKIVMAVGDCHPPEYMAALATSVGVALGTSWPPEMWEKIVDGLRENALIVASDFKQARENNFVRPQ
jgi:hypothetical protein